MTTEAKNTNETLDNMIETEECDQFVLIEESQFVPALLQDC